jgi:translation initiation factor IF-2
VTIFQADVIYHLFDSFEAYLRKLERDRADDARQKVVFPCVLSILVDCIFNTKSPIIIGVEVKEGLLKVGTPLVIPTRDMLCIGRVTSIKHNDQSIEEAVAGQRVSISIHQLPEDKQKYTYGRHFDHTDKLFSHITRASIDILKEHYPQFLSVSANVRLIVKLKKYLHII